jgi:hypothetical protein
MSTNLRRPNPYYVFGPRPFRERRVAAYILRERHRGRTLDAILADPYLERLGGETLCWRALTNPATIAALGHDAADEIRACRPDRAPS